MIKGFTDEFGAVHTFFFRRLGRLHKTIKALPRAAADSSTDSINIHSDFGKCLRGFTRRSLGATGNGFNFSFGQACLLAHFAQGGNQRLHFFRAVHVFQRRLENGAHSVRVCAETGSSLAKVLECLCCCLTDAALYLLDL